VLPPPPLQVAKDIAIKTGNAPANINLIRIMRFSSLNELFYDTNRQEIDFYKNFLFIFQKKLIQ
jgi:hypothetical protein